MKVATLVSAALAILPATFAAPAAEADASALVERSWGNWQPACNAKTMKVRKDFQKMKPKERKAYTDAINCLRSKPSQLDQTLYSAATDRFMDWAVTHVNRTKVVHLDGFFLTWHRYYLWLFEQDLEKQCGYTGAFPYWNWIATSDNLQTSTIFNGDEYSMSGDGYFTNNDPIVLAPTFSIPHGSGGGCIMSGPFKGMNKTMDDISNGVIVQGLPLPPTAFVKNSSCLTRDLNSAIAKRWTNATSLALALDATSVADFSTQINGVFGGSALGLHSGAHFTMGSPASSLFVSPQDPIWYPLHTMLDNVYSQWQARHPELAQQVYGTMTAGNIPPSANVTLDSVHPDWGVFSSASITIRELLSINSGPFCYRYDYAL